jgi:hypothetical protein
VLALLAALVLAADPAPPASSPAPAPKTADPFTNPDGSPLSDAQIVAICDYLPPASVTVEIAKRCGLAKSNEGARLINEQGRAQAEERRRAEQAAREERERAEQAAREADSKRVLREASCSSRGGHIVNGDCIPNDSGNVRCSSRTVNGTTTTVCQ